MTNRISILQNYFDSREIISSTTSQTPIGHTLTYTAYHSLSELKGIYAIILPFDTDTHLLGIPTANDFIRIMPTVSTLLEELDLEGDYGSYFHAYVEQGGQSVARYLLDPEAMLYSTMFLKSCIWEIIDRTLLLLDDSLLPDLEVIDQFIANITPATAPTPALSVQVIASTEETRPYRGTLFCPLCHGSLSLGKNWLTCTAGHGYLLTGAQLLQTRRDSSSFAKQLSTIMGRVPKFYTPGEPITHSTIKCPNCTNEMQPLNYQDTNILIDVCRSCPYRWIDVNELNSTLGAYRNE